MGLLKVNVPARHSAVVYRKGRLQAVLGSGAHRKQPRDRVRLVDLRERLLTVAPQEVPTADGVPVKVSASVQWSVRDPQRFLEYAADPEAMLYLATQIAVREAVAPVSLEQVIGRSAVDSASLSASVAPAAEAIGAIAAVVVRDVIVPGALREAALEVASAKQRGAARLEEARAETAALRSLANGARLLDDSPALERLRLVQAAGYGAQLVLHLDRKDDEK
ncbi:slipin family protein [Blastococcus sp. Marseille-P5729]|uniref:slipin family protein n=1 Tax=Blastococcus sp. Marseille-P5729 TaxID=2086582 RepID=UPI000D109436|nr:slipin family protein [Blastococcus sp. Marseille-P5729]